MAVLAVRIEPDPDDPDCAVPFVEGTVAGRTYRFVLDTGAARTTMLADEYTTGLPSSGTDQGHGAFAAVSETAVTVTDLSVGPLYSASLDVARVDGRGPGENLLGMDVLGRYRCHFRFAAGVVTCARPAGGLAPI
jgi:predicted aspartyl protease